MNKQERLKALAKIAKEAKLNKTAQDAINAADDAQSGEEFAHRVFEALVDNLHIDGLDE